jgi:hypothetical protein
VCRCDAPVQALTFWDSLADALEAAEWPDCRADGRCVDDHAVVFRTETGGYRSFPVIPTERNE